MSNIVREVEPFFFGDVGALLYGCFHPASGSKRKVAAVLCPAFSDEAIRVHRAYKQLALRLSRAGFPVMRFDYYGTGDSAGEDNEATLECWQANISLAIEEVKKRSGVTRVVLIGLRLGAALALRVASHQPDIDGVVLWEPVINGEDYLQELADAHENRLNYYLTNPIHSANPSSHIRELIGFVLSATMQTEIQQVNLLDTVYTKAEALIVEKTATEAAALLNDHLQRQSIRVAYQCLDDPAIWGEDPDKALIPGQTLKAIISWFNETYV